MTDIRVLTLVTTSDARFFQQQVSVLDRNGVEVTTLAVPGERVADDDGVVHRSVFDYLRFFPQVVGRSFGDYDLLHANYGLTAPAAVLQPNLPVVLSLWGTDLMGKYGPVSAACARRCEAVVVMSAEMARRLDAPCHVIPHGVDLERFTPRPQRDAQNDLGWDHDARHVLFPYPTGREVKDFPRAKRVVDDARERVDAPVELQTVSGVPHDRMSVYMNAADALLVTSRREGSPNSVKEAMACNLPVVSTDVGDVRERLVGVTHSHVCTSDEELVAALATTLNAGERSDGREAAREVSVERTTERLLGVYQSVLSD